MLHFFRKIRRDLLTNNQFFKYLKYAIGEIILVMIGILLALYVNNWNEGRKSEERAKLLFSQVQKELLYNINRTNYAIDVYVDRDTLFHSVSKRKVTYNDYELNPYLCRLITDVDLGVEAQDNAFRLLIENEGTLTPEQDSLVNKLRNLYSLDLLKVNAYDDQINNMIIDFRRKLKEEKNWYSDLIGGSGYGELMSNLDTIDMFAYFLNDPTYLNEVQDFISLGYSRHLRSILGFRTRAISIYKEIAIYLNKTTDPIIEYDENDFSKYIGSYKNDKGSPSSFEENWTVVIRKERDGFHLEVFESDSLTDSYKVHPYKKDSYIADYEIKGENEGVLNKFIYDKNTDRIGLILLGDYGPRNKERPTFYKID